MNTARIRTKPRKLGLIFRKINPVRLNDVRSCEIRTPEGPDFYPPKPSKRTFTSIFVGTRRKISGVKEPKENLVDRTKYSIHRLKKGWLLKLWKKGFVKTHKGQRTIIKRTRKFLVDTEHRAHSILGISVHGCELCNLPRNLAKESQEFEESWVSLRLPECEIKTLEDRRRDHGVNFNAQDRWMKEFETEWNKPTNTPSIITIEDRRTARVPLEVRLEEHARCTINNIRTPSKGRLRYNKECDGFRYKLTFKSGAWGFSYTNQVGVLITKPIILEV